MKKNNDGIEKEYSLQDQTECVLDQFFPKGKCKERGQALVMYAELLIRVKNNFRLIPKTDAPEKWVEPHIETECVPLGHKDYWKKIITLKWRGEK